MTKPLLPGDPQRLGGYDLLGRLGQGGMGTVFLGRATDGRLVAVKVIRPEFAGEEQFRGRFRSEVSRARQVPPFCTAEVLDADPDHATPYLVVEYVDGPSLAQVVDDQGPLGAGSLYSVAIGVATALTAIHGAGVIHRDLKPGNVLFALGTPKVIDFGIARALEVTSHHTRTDQMVGTVAYMAPERFESGSRPISAAADVFAWGAVVAYAGTCRTPFAADSAAATAARILTQPPDLSGLPMPLRDLVALTLAKDPAERPTAHELLELLLAARPQEDTTLAGLPELRRAAEAAHRTGRQSTGERRRRGRTMTASPAPRRRPVGRIVAAGVAVTALVAGVAGYGLRDRSGLASPATATATATGTAPAPRKVRGPSVVDRLDRPGQWRAVTDDPGGSCAFTGGRLVMSTGLNGTHECPGPTDSFAGNQLIAVTVALVAPDSCALVWFRHVQRTGYLLSLCQGEIRLDLDDNSTDTPLAAAASALLRPGGSHRVQVELREQVATVAVDGQEILRAPVTDPSLVAGKVVLGVATGPTASQGTVAYTDVEIRSL